MQDAIELEHARDQLMRGIVQKIAATLTMAFVGWLLWTRFEQAAEYALAHFSDAAGGGEWYGYCDRDGRVTHPFKGGPYKGCFHVPRALLKCEAVLERLAARSV